MKVEKVSAIEVLGVWLDGQDEEREGDLEALAGAREAEEGFACPGLGEPSPNVLLGRALIEMDTKLDEVFARVKKGNSLMGMLVGRFPQKAKTK